MCSETHTQHLNPQDGCMLGRHSFIDVSDLACKLARYSVRRRVSSLSTLDMGLSNKVSHSTAAADAEASRYRHADVEESLVGN